MPSDNREAYRQSLIIYNEFSALLSQWPGSFTVDVDGDYFQGQFEVMVTHVYYKIAHYIFARINADGGVEICSGEEYWEDLDQGTLFAFFWFDLADKLRGDL